MFRQIKLLFTLNHSSVCTVWFLALYFWNGFPDAVRCPFVLVFSDFYLCISIYLSGSMHVCLYCTCMHCYSSSYYYYYYYYYHHHHYHYYYHHQYYYYYFRRRRCIAPLQGILFRSAPSPTSVKQCGLKSREERAEWATGVRRSAPGIPLPHCLVICETS